MMNATTATKTECRVDVLLVEDSPNLCRILRRWIETRGYSTATARSADEAEQIAATTLPKVVIADIGLPDRSGYALRESLRKIPQLRQSCFIALTGDTDGREEAQALKAGFDHFISKPPEFEKLSDVLHACLRQHTDDRASAGA